MSLLRSGLASAPRTLVDIFDETVEESRRPALDNGAEVLTYAEFAEAAERARRRARRAGVGAGDRVGVRISVGHPRPLRRHPGDPACGRRLRAGRRRRPRGAGPRWSSARRRSRRSSATTWSIRRSARGTGAPTRATNGDRRRRGRRLGDLHLRVDRHARRASRSPTASPPRSSTPRHGSSSRSAPLGSGRPGDGGALGGLRRLLRGDVAGLAPRRLPGPGPAVAGAQRRRPRTLAGGQRHHRRLHGPDAGRAVARRVARPRSGC